ncbi:MAG TPA: M13 family metallopeptidase [Polyangiaceae bacterium]|nr:M13 family metallopeptidase [Polyangiaceae bacterium]
MTPPPAATASGKPVQATTLEAVGLDAKAMDRTANPCTDFYQFACGTWLAQTPIPADEAVWSRSFSEIRKRNELELKRILEEAAVAGENQPTTQKIGAFYAACMDEARVDAALEKPIQPLLEKVRKIRDRKELARVVAELHRVGIWPFFDLSPVQDSQDATHWIANLDQGGLGLPDRDYYLRTDPDSVKLLEKYREHVERMLVLAKVPAAQAKVTAGDVIAIETELAQVSKTRVERRDARAMFNRWKKPALLTASPAFEWNSYLTGVGVPAFEELNVTAPKFVEGVQAVLTKHTPAQLRGYLEWHIVHATAPLLAKPFVDENFRFEQVLTGQPELRSRFRRCVAATDRALGDLLAQAYVERNFSGESKPAAERMVFAIGAQFKTALERLTWMDAATRGRAREKLERMAYLIGYPKVWKSYDFPIDRARYAESALAARAFDLKRELNKVGQPVDRDEWQMTAPTVNAYYDPQRNHMVFPAGILQPPFYNVGFAVPVNLGAIGMVVGHELTHGFDDEGSQYDAQGNLTNWWEPAVGERFKQKTSCVSKQYDAYEVLPGLHVNGALTLGENIADLGGVKLAFHAYQELQKNASVLKVADGFSEDQQFFLAYGQAWCARYRPELQRLLVQTDPHSPPRFRVNGPLTNLPEFAQAFSCKPAQPVSQCEVW